MDNIESSLKAFREEFVHFQASLLLAMDERFKKVYERIDLCATKKDLEGFATKKDLEGFATKEDLSTEVAKLATKKDLEGFATKEDLSTEVAKLATKKDLEGFATKKDLEGFATKEDLSTEVAKLATKDDLVREIAKCATKEQFKLLEGGIARIDGKLEEMKNNMKAFVVRDELPQDILSRLKIKSGGAFVVREDSQEYKGGS